jgi:hypothetical protein
VQVGADDLGAAVRRRRRRLDDIVSARVNSADLGAAARRAGAARAAW